MPYAAEDNGGPPDARRDTGASWLPMAQSLATSRGDSAEHGERGRQQAGPVRRADSSEAIPCKSTELCRRPAPRSDYEHAR